MPWDPQAFDDQLLESAIRHHQSGHLEEAMANCRQVLSRQPNHPAALHLVGLIARQIGRLDASVEIIRRSVTGNTADPHFFNDLADALRTKRQYEEAFAACQQALRIKPDFPEIYITLGNVLADQGQHDAAITAAREALRLRPNYALALNNLGVYLHNKGETQEAIAAARQAIQLDPGFPEFHNNLGRALQDNDQWDESIAARRDAIRLKPDFAEAYNDLGNALRDNGQVEESIAALHRAIQLWPDYALAHWNLSLSLLLQGDFTQGWREYEWRWKWDGFTSAKRNFPQPLWTGEPLHGKTILLYAEQGLGDAIQFARFAPMVAHRGGRVIVECQPTLQHLFSTLHSVQTVIPEGQPLPPFDVQCPFMSLPLAFQTDLKSVPATIPYLKPDRKKSAKWKQRVIADSAIRGDQLRRIGLVWAGSTKHKKDQARSLKLSDFAPLANIPGTIFFSLQKGEAAKQTPPPEMNLHDYTEELTDFADTAALLDQLDLIITVDTSVAHLAGAMGKPVWILTSFAPDWRWLRNREDSPWYPTMRIFRQAKRDDWTAVIEQVAKALTV